MFMMAIAISLGVSAQIIIDDDNENIEEYVPGQVVLRNFVFSVGAKAGGNYSLTSSSYSDDFGLTGGFGYSAGVAANVKFVRPVGRSLGAERFGVQIEGLFSDKRISINDLTLDMRTVELPILLQWYYIPGFCLEVGPTFTSVISASPDKISLNSNYVIHTGQITGNDVMLTLGLGYKDKSGFTASLRYNKANSFLANNMEIMVSTLTVSIGWLFTAVK